MNNDVIWEKNLRKEEKTHLKMMKRKFLFSFCMCIFEDIEQNQTCRTWTVRAKDSLLSKITTNQILGDLNKVVLQRRYHCSAHRNRDSHLQNNQKPISKVTKPLLIKKINKSTSKVEFKAPKVILLKLYHKQARWKGNNSSEKSFIDDQADLSPWSSQCKKGERWKGKIILEMKTSSTTHQKKWLAIRNFSFYLSRPRQRNQEN